MRSFLWMIPCLLLGCYIVDLEPYSLDVALPRDITSYAEAENWVYYNIAFIPDGGKDYWQTPSETMDRRGGDCEDANILLLSFLRELGADPNTLELHLVLTYGGTGHALAYSNGSYYDATGYGNYDVDDVYQIIEWNDIPTMIMNKRY